MRKAMIALAFAWAIVPASAFAKPNVIGVPATDKRMEAAKAQGRATYDAFLARLANPQAGDSGFMVKFDLIPGPGVEFIWAADLRMERDTLTGILTDEPMDSRFQNGQRLTIARAAVIDWGYFRDGRMEGGYTERVVIDRMPPSERAAQLKNLGWQ